MPERDDLEQALNAGLASLAAGDGLEQVLARYPTLAGELQPLLMAAQMAGAAAKPAPVPTAIQAVSRAQFLARASELRTAAPAARRSLWAGQPRLARALAAGLLLVSSLGIGTYGAVTASAQSLPGDALYGVKRTVERTELLLAPDDEARGRLQAQFDERRLMEVQAVTEQRRTVRVDFTGTLERLNGAGSDHWLVSGVVVVVGPQVPVAGYATLGAQLDVEGTVETDGLVLAEHITVLPATPPAATATAAPSPTLTASPRPVATATPAPAQAVAFSGILQTIQAGAWQIDGRTVIVDAATEIHDNPQVGQIVSVEASRRADGTLVARRIGLVSGSVSAATQWQSSTDDHSGGGPPASRTPEPTDDHGGGGPPPSRTPEPTDDHGGGGPSPSHTPEPTEIGGGGSLASHTPEPTDNGGGGPSASNTPQPTDNGGPLATHAPEPTDDHGGGSSPSNTPPPTDDHGGGGL